jgi:hypothetical protein
LDLIEFSLKEHLSILAMKEITIQIPDEKLQFFMQLMKELDVEVFHHYDIPEEHMNIVRDRIAKSELNPGYLEDWDKIKDQFDLES